MPSSGNVGQIGWIDLTVPGAESVRDFYREVVGSGAVCALYQSAETKG